MDSSPTTSSRSRRDHRMNPKLLFGCAVAVVALLLGTTGTAAAFQQNHRSSQVSRDVATVRVATDQFHNIAVAEQAKYGLLADLAGITCIDMPGMGAMGVHWANT